MRDVVALQQRGQNAAGTQRVRVERGEDENRRREGVVRAQEVLVQVRDEVAGDVHAGLGWAVLCCEERDEGPRFEVEMDEWSMFEEEGEMTARTRGGWYLSNSKCL